MTRVCQFFRAVFTWFSGSTGEQPDGDFVSPQWLADREYRAGKSGYSAALLVAVLLTSGCTNDLPTAPTPIQVDPTIECQPTRPNVAICVVVEPPVGE